MRILVIEDDPVTAQVLQQGLAQHRYAVDVCDTAANGRERAIADSYDVIILDVMLPDGSGVEICQRLREHGIGTPLLMLTALSATDDKVAGLNAGADDYLVKPFEFDELLARVRALLRRGQARGARLLRFADVELDLDRQRARRGRLPVHLSPKEFALLEFLIRNPERVLTRTAIGEHVWDMNFEPGSNVIDVYVSSLRRKIDRGFEPALIHTVVGSGYRFGLPDETMGDA